MVTAGTEIIIGTLPNGTPVHGTVIWVHPEGRFVLTEREGLHGHKIRECAFFGKRRGQFANRVVGGWT